MYTDFKPTSLLDSGLGDMEEYNRQLQAQMAQRQAMEQQAQPQQRQAPDQSQGTDNVSFLEKLAMTIVPQSYQNINNVSTQRRNQANAPQAADYQALGEYWIDKDPQKAQQYLAMADRQAKQRGESERTQRLQSVLGGVQGGTGGAQAVSGNAGYSQQAEQLARAGIQLMQQGDLEGGQELIKQADALNKLRTEGRETRLGNRVVNSDPYSIGQSLAIGVSPDAQLSAATTRRGQDISARTAANAQANASSIRKPLNPTETKLFDETEKTLSSSSGAVQNLERALEINDLAYSGVGASLRAKAVSQLGDDPRANATVELNNLIGTQALQSLKTVFGGNPTEGERKILLDLQASADKTPPQRAAIIDRALEMAKSRIAADSKKLNAIATGTYGTAEYLQQPQARPKDQPKPKKYNPATGRIE